MSDTVPTPTTSPLRATTSPARSPVAAVAAVVVPTVATVVHAALYGRWIVDDAAITFAYARSVASGHGAVLQPGADPVEGYSNPSWLLLLALGRTVGLFDRGAWWGTPDYVLFPKLLATACCVAIFAAFLSVCRSCSVSRPALVAGLTGCALAANPSFVAWAFSGLEGALLTASLAGLVALLARVSSPVSRGHADDGRSLDRVADPRVAIGAGLLAALAALTRPEGAVYVLVYGVVLLVARPRPTIALRAAAVSLGAFALPVAAHTAWRWVTFGALVPNTAVAKAQDLPGPAALLRPLELVAYVGWLPSLGGTLLIAVAARDARVRGPLVVLLTALVLALGAFSVLEPDWMPQHRFAAPIWAFGTLVCGLGLAASLDAGRHRRLVPVTAVVTAVAALIAFAGHASALRDHPVVPMCSVANYAGWSVNAAAEALDVQEGTLATPDVGGTALVSRFRVLDVAGLADPVSARAWANQDMPALRDHVLGHRPEFVELHHEWSAWSGLLHDARFLDAYVAVRRTATLDGLWVRRDLIEDAEALSAARSAAPPPPPRVDLYQGTAPRDSCGDRMR